MNCPKCTENIEEKHFDINVEEVSQKDMVEITVTCPHCHWFGYNYLHNEGFLDTDPETAA
jgi:uncharacterized protein with PIN domain